MPGVRATLRLAAQMGACMGRGALLFRALPPPAPRRLYFPRARPLKMTQNPVVHLWRADLRLHDNPALHASLRDAIARNVPWLALWLAPADGPTPWGFARISARRRVWWLGAAQALAAALRGHGHRLWQLPDPRPEALRACVQALRPSVVHAETIPAPEEEAVLHTLEDTGVPVQRHWQSTLHDPSELPFDGDCVPRVFSDFRRAIEAAGCRERAPLAPPERWPDALDRVDEIAASLGWRSLSALPADALDTQLALDRRHTMPLDQLPRPWAGEAAALCHLRRYFAQGAARSYKTTRNQLRGQWRSSHWSLWLATGALSPRQALFALRTWQQRHGSDANSDWLRVELLWRDHFRWLHRRYGRALYRARGLAERAPQRAFDPERWQRWRDGRTGCALVDAGMRELAATGYLSNRMRQIVASYWLNEMQGDWRLGAAWFEHHLLDYDPCSNTGNWLYIAGLGSDPRGGRHFNPDKQAREHDPEGSYRRLWLADAYLSTAS